MGEGFWFAIVTAVVLVIVVVIAAIGIFFSKDNWKPKLQPWENSNGSYKETKLDKTIPTPTVKPTLSQFGKADNNQPLWCIPSWYAIRYVDKNGNYSDLGPWSEKVVSSCSVPGLNCNGCNSFLPMLSIPSADSRFSANVHRQTQAFHPDIEGDLIGAFFPASNGWIFIDNNNPNTDGSYCGSCQNCDKSIAECT